MDPDPLVRGEDPDPHQNVTEPQQCSQLICNNVWQELEARLNDEDSVLGGGASERADAEIQTDPDPEIFRFLP